MILQIIMRIVIGLLIICLGVLMVYKTNWFLSMIGRVAFAEKFFGGGGTRTFYKLMGIGICFLGLIVATNLFDQIVGGFIMRIFG
ncbi:MAG: hypothetical protein ABH846_02315 [Patescibacteria group bacterium]